MPKLPHEALVELIRRAPGLIPDLMWPGECTPTPIRVTAAEFIDLNFAEHRADAVIAMGGTTARPAEALVVEVQISVDPRKHDTWPVYVAGLRARLGCPVVLVVVAVDAAVASWCAEPIDLGRGRNVLYPWVLGPSAVPIVTDLEEARAAPELAVLSVAAHAHELGAEYIAIAAVEAARDLDDQRGIFYPDFVVALLGRAARTALEKLMATGQYKPQSDMFLRYWEDGEAAGVARGKAEGKAEGTIEGRVHGKAEVVLKLLHLRGLAPDEAERERILACRDEDVLETWVSRVLTATSLDELFAGTL